MEEQLKQFPVTEALAKAVQLAEKEIEAAIGDIEFSGSTSVMVFVNGQELYTANVGDSRAIICALENGSMINSYNLIVIQGKAITRDHKPEEPDEAARILSQGRIEAFKGTINIMLI